MRVGQMLAILWAVAAFYVTALCFHEMFQLIADVQETWQKRLIDSNIEFAMALFFILIIALWHGVTADLIKKLSGPWLLYRSAAFPALLAVAFILMIPFDFSSNLNIGLLQIATVALWFLLVGDPFLIIGKAIASSEWFRSNVLKADSNSRSMLFQGLRGWSGVAMLHVGLVLFYLAAFFR